MLNASSKFKRQLGDWKDKKGSLRSELARGFNLIACKNYDFYLFIKNHIKQKKSIMSDYFMI